MDERVRAGQVPQSVVGVTGLARTPAVRAAQEGPGGGVVADPRVHLVGYGPSASTIGANRAGRAAAREVAALLRLPHRHSSVLP